jgi:hypothetical protein
MACRIAHSLEWSNRLLHEMMYHRGAVFLTLTYDNLNIPEDFGLRKSDLQKFFKRLRKNHSDLDIKYFASGEYGSETSRPHYHCIILGLSPMHEMFKQRLQCKNGVQAVCDDWPYGNVYLGSVTKSSIRYTVDYTLKKVSKDDINYDGRPLPFQLQSIGIGKRYALDNAGSIKVNLFIRSDGRPGSVPRYYHKILSTSKAKRADKSKEANELEEREYLSLGVEYNKIPGAQRAHRRQKDIELNARINLKKKGKI